MLRKLDQYVLSSFIPDFFVTLFAMAGMFVVVDLFQNLGDFVQLGFKRGIASVVQYYAYFLPTSLPDWIPAIVLVGAGLTLVRLAKNNELLAMKASGVSLTRILVPLFVAATIISLFSGVDREWIAPRLWPQKNRLEEMIKGKRRITLCTADDKENRQTVRVWQYDRKQHTMKSIYVIQKYADGRLKSVIQAKEGEWEGGNLHLYHVRKDDWSKDGRPLGGRRLETFILETSLKPRDLEKSPLSPAALNIFDLYRLCKEHAESYEFEVSFHNRLVDPLRGIVLLLIGIPFILGKEGLNRSRFLGILKAILVCAAFYTLGFVATNLGRHGHLHPVLAAWAPTIMFGSVGLLLFDSMQS